MLTRFIMLSENLLLPTCSEKEFNAEEKSSSKGWVCLLEADFYLIQASMKIAFCALGGNKEMIMADIAGYKLKHYRKWH